ncbi:hypothetical protein M406DRAFT_105884 [Cryphonectria parasitica EP155]|uniref:Thioredoxin domain-containing protein n=1 Tax=Cryphonectria parasitica (strain ATCC 38755 / EP155) TaxID=660469 RepID=A0A9P4Y310_CRYP1|nr:uncharacterized protein M406DRAFT_105884 [Cryphonectria parasitica EP155]KAF3765578.1 hypothetical protein M406DRAFT_105884 [Cryphonectria parasitica EP155]
MSSTDHPQSIADAAASQAAASKIPQFLIIYANIVDGKSWCGDCRVAEPLVNKKFPQGGPKRLGIYYAGDRETWRKSDNPWRKFGVPALPTLYKVTPDGTWSKLVEAEVYDEKKLNEFVDSS